jgi:DNA-binding beta-propeller fold protein YncE
LASRTSPTRAILDEVRLQHPQGIDVWKGQLYITDTYNNKVKRVSPGERRVVTVVGAGSTGFTDGAAGLAELHEPGGLSVANGKLYVADTNNHAIRVVDLESWEVSTLELVF